MQQFTPQRTSADPATVRRDRSHRHPQLRSDLERCRLLCETMDQHVTGMSTHYILVEQRDVALFTQLEVRNRTVVDERDLLPTWLHAYWDPTQPVSAAGSGSACARRRCAAGMSSSCAALPAAHTTETKPWLLRFRMWRS